MRGINPVRDIKLIDSKDELFSREPAEVFKI